MKRSEVLATLLAVALVISPVVPFVVAFSQPIAGATGPSGMVGVPNSQIEDLRHPSISTNISASDISVYATENASSLEVDIVTEAQARKVAAGSAPSSVAGKKLGQDPTTALVLSDSENSAGRTVALEAAAVKDALGHIPTFIRVQNSESGEEWKYHVEERDGWLYVNINHFSSNTVTFTGEFVYKGASASDGASFQYDVNNVDVVDNYTIDLTGIKNTQWDNVSKTGISSGGSISTNVAGNMDPAGPSANGEPEIIFTGEGSNTDRTKTTNNINPQGGSQSLSLSGNLEPTDSDGSGNPILTVDAPSDTTYNQEPDADSTQANGDYFIYDDANDNYWRETQHRFEPDATGYVTSITFHVGRVDGDGGTGAFDIYIESGAPDDEFGASPGTKVASSVNVNSWTTGQKTFSISDYYVTAGNTYTINLIGGSSDNDGSYDTMRLAGTNDPSGTWHRIQYSNGNSGGSSLAGKIDFSIDRTVEGLSASVPSGDSVSFGTVTGGETPSKRIDVKKSDSSIDFSASQGSQIDATIEILDREASKDPSADIDGDNVADVSYNGLLNSGETSRHEIAGLTTADNSIDISLTSGTVQADVKLKERTQTVDPTIEVNGHTTSHSGTLTDGSSVSLSTQKSWVQTGTNKVNISVGSGSLSADAPKAQVDLNYSHDTEDSQSVIYQDEQWTSRYNVSKTYSSSRASASMDLTYSSRVVSHRDLEYRINQSGGWANVPASDYTLSGSDLSVDVASLTGGSVMAGSTVEIRSNASKVQTSNVSIAVTEASGPTESLNSQIKFETVGTDPYIDVGPTQEGDRVHHLTSESWKNSAEYVVIEADGDQKLHLPKVEAGDSARVTNLSTKVEVGAGDVKISVIEGGSTPKLDVSPGPKGSGDPVDVTYYRTSSGTKYLLKSVARDIILDSAVAQSPVVFSDDDSSETWEILKDTGSSGGTSDPSSAVGQFRERSEGFISSVIENVGLVPLILIGVLLALITVISRFLGWDLPLISGGDTREELEAAGESSLGITQTFLSWVSDLTSIVLENRIATVAVGLVGLIVSARVGLIQIPEGTSVLVIVAGVPVGSYLILRRTGRVSQRVWIASTLVSVILGLEFVAPGALGTVLDNLTSENVAPLLIIAAGVGIYLWYRSRQNDRPQIIIGGNND